MLYNLFERTNLQITKPFDYEKDFIYWNYCYCSIFVQR